MNILASCSLEESQKYTGVLSIPREDNPNKVDKVFINVVIEDGDTSILNNLRDNIKCVTFRGDVDFSNVEIPENKVFLESNFGDDIKEYPGVINLVRLPNDYCNMRAVYDLCQSYENVRVIGGNLLNIEGVRIGRYDAGKEKGSSVYKDVYDQFVEIPISELDNIQEVIKKAKRKLDDGTVKEKKIKVKKEKPQKNKGLVQSFNNLFDTAVEEF